MGKNEHEVMINKVELASMLAHEVVCNLYDGKVFKNLNAKTLKYKPNIQPIFDDFYDEYMGKIIKSEVKEDKFTLVGTLLLPKTAILEDNKVKLVVGDHWEVTSLCRIIRFSDNQKSVMLEHKDYYFELNIMKQ